MDVPGKIVELLYQHDCVIIPEFGGFVANYKSSKVDYDRNIFSPPSKEVGFNNQLVHNDGLLISAISLENAIPYPAARKLVQDFVRDTQRKLAKGKKLVFAKLGTFYVGKDKSLQFDPDSSTNFLLSSFGLSAFEYHELEEYDINKRIQSRINVRKSREGSGMSRILVRGLVAVPILIALVMVPIKTGLLDIDTAKIAMRFTKKEVPVSLNETAAEKTVQLNQASLINTDTNFAEERSEEITSPVDPVAVEEAVVEKTGMVKPEVEPVLSEEPVITKQLIKSSYLIMTGSFKNVENAKKLESSLRKEGYLVGISNGPNGFFRVSINGNTRFSDAKRQMQSYLNDHPGEDCWILPI